MLKSGTDFRNMSKISVKLNGKKPAFNIERIDFDSSFPEDETMKAEIEKMTGDEHCLHLSVQI